MPTEGEGRGLLVLVPLGFSRPCWEVEGFDFGHGVSVVRVEDSVRQFFHARTSSRDVPFPETGSSEKPRCDWTLSVRLPSTQGFASELAVEMGLVLLSVFQSTLALEGITQVGANWAFCVRGLTDVPADVVSRYLPSEPRFEEFFVPRFRPWDSEVERPDLEAIKTLFGRRLELMDFQRWQALIFSVDFWERVHSEGRQMAERDMRRILLRLETEGRSGESGLDRDDLLRAGQDLAMQHTLERAMSLAVGHREGTAASKTRLGRSLQAFDKAGTLPFVLDAVVRLFIALETLFGTEGMKHDTDDICKRASCLLAGGGDAQERRRIRDQLGDCFFVRGRIVHGHQIIDDAPDEVIERIFAYARGALRRIILDGALFERFCDPSDLGAKTLFLSYDKNMA